MNVFIFLSTVFAVFALISQYVSVFVMLLTEEIGSKKSFFRNLIPFYFLFTFVKFAINKYKDLPSEKD